MARKVARNPNATTPADVQALRNTGLNDGRIFAVTAFVALRGAFSTINDSLGAQPDAELARTLPREVREAVTYGRPVGSSASYLTRPAATRGAADRTPPPSIGTSREVLCPARTKSGPGRRTLATRIILRPPSTSPARPVRPKLPNLPRRLPPHRKCVAPADVRPCG